MMSEASPSIPAADLAALSDEDLLKLYRESGQSQAFEILVRRHERELYRYLARYLGDPALAEDVFQNTFLQLHQKRALYEPGRPVRPWLYSIATHQAVDELRKRKRQAALSIDATKENSSHEPKRCLASARVARRNASTIFAGRSGRSSCANRSADTPS